MSKKNKDKGKDNKKKKSGNNAGRVIGTAIRTIVIFFGFILKIFVKTCAIFGLWLPLVYALFGLILHWALGFNPFTFDTLGTLYLCGGIACIVGAAIISVRNLVVKPAKSIYEGYKHPLWEKEKPEEEEEEQEKEEELSKRETRRKLREEERYSPPEIERFRPTGKKGVDYGDLLAPLSDFDEREAAEEARARIRQDWLPKQQGRATETPRTVSVPPVEKPQVYFSTLEPDVLVHEYSDRFELYKVSGHRTIPIGVEYK